MCHEQYNRTTGQSGCLPTALTLLVNSILHENGVGIFKYVHGVIEGYAVLPLIRPRLHRIPFESKCHYTIITPNV